jgi:phage-related holin
MGMQIWMSWTIVAYILITVLVDILDKENGFFGGIFFFLVQNSISFLRKLTKFSIPQNEK